MSWAQGGIGAGPAARRVRPEVGAGRAARRVPPEVGAGPAARRLALARPRRSLNSPNVFVGRGQRAGVGYPAFVALTEWRAMVTRVERSQMDITFLGQAGFFIRSKAGSIFCDPWFNPAYFGSWFPFPANYQIDPETIGSPDYLYISHLHHDHFDPEFLRAHVSKEAQVVL